MSLGLSKNAATPMPDHPKKAVLLEDLTCTPSAFMKSLSNIGARYTILVDSNNTNLVATRHKILKILHPFTDFLPSYLQSNILKSPYQNK